MTQLPRTDTEPLSPADDIPPALLDAVAGAIFRAYTAAPRPGDDTSRWTETKWTRYAHAAITAVRDADAANSPLPRDWRASEVGPNTPYTDEPNEMVPPGTYILGGFTDEPEAGPNLILRVEQAVDDDNDLTWTHESLAQAVADRLNGGHR